MSSVLVIDDDASTLLTYKHILQHAGHLVTTSALGEDGLAAARRERPDVVICDECLPDCRGVDIIREIRRCCVESAIVWITGWGSPDLVTEAKHNGADSCVEKPLNGVEILCVIDAACQHRHSFAAASEYGYAARRVSAIVARAACVTSDYRTVSGFCHELGISRSTLKSWCRSAGMPSKALVDFVRLLHIVLVHAGGAWHLQYRLNIVDARTAEALLRRAGFAPEQPVPDLETFLSRQTLTNATAVVEAIRSYFTSVNRS